ncbi:MAG: hypothetical protein HY295_00150 [Thaumarchaeota archaeon]|nr:hypothetical protein [Nitrososphaerota archaeon]
MKTLLLSIIAISLIIGICIVIIFVVTINPKPNIGITIEGLKDTYNVGEQFRFYVKVNGYGKFCGDPYVAVSTATNPTEIIWSYSGQEFLGMCPSRDIQYTFGTRLISINQTGSYIVSIPFGDKVIRKEFTVISSQQGAFEEKMITLAGDMAWRVCGALGIPCPLNPTFHAKQMGNQSYVVIVEINGKPYTVTLNSTYTCVSPAIYGRPSCYYETSCK